MFGAVRQMFHRLTAEASPRQGAKPACGSAFLIGLPVKSAFALLLTKVTKHIPPQTSPVGSSLAGIWSTLADIYVKHCITICITKQAGIFNCKEKNDLNTECVLQFVQHKKFCITVCRTNLERRF